MTVHPDFSALLGLFNGHGVDYLIVGGFAMAFHGAPRYTGDIGLYVRPAPENARRIVQSLDAFGFASAGLTEADFSEPDRVVQLGYPPVRIDVVTSLTGVSWKKAQASSVPGDCGGTPVRYLGRAALIANKRAAGRKQDLADLEALGAE